MILQKALYYLHVRQNYNRHNIKILPFDVYTVSECCGKWCEYLTPLLQTSHTTEDCLEVQSTATTPYCGLWNDTQQCKHNRESELSKQLLTDYETVNFLIVLSA